MSNVYSRVYATEKCRRQLIVQGCGKQRGGDDIIRKRDFKLQYGWLYRLMREKCVLRTVIESSVTQMTILKVKLLVYLKITYIFTGCS